MKFRANNGNYLTHGLFLETVNGEQNPQDCSYTLKPYDHKGRPSLKRLYLEMEDATEFEFANKHLEDFPHWEKLCRSPFFKDHLEQWRKELGLKLKARALRMIIKDAAEGKYDANKFLVANGWIEKNNPGEAKRGRPSKQEIKEELTRQSEIEQSLQEDLKRISELN